MNNKVLAELDFVFSQLPPSYLKKIPQEMIEEAKNNKDLDWYNRFDKNIPFTKQELSDKTLQILNKLVENLITE